MVSIDKNHMQCQCVIYGHLIPMGLLFVGKHNNLYIHGKHFKRFLGSSFYAKVGIIVILNGFHRIGNCMEIKDEILKHGCC